MGIDELHPGLAAIPSFRPPAHHRRLDPPTAELPEVDPESPPASPSTSPLQGPGPDASPFDPSSHRPDLDDRPATRTATSSAGTEPRPASPKETAKLVAGLLGLLMLGVAGLVRWSRRGRVQLRQPTPEQLDDIAAPLARIAMRHVPAALLTPDLVDAGLAGAAVANYVNDGQLVAPVDVDPGVPAADPSTTDPEGVPA